MRPTLPLALMILLAFVFLAAVPALAQMPTGADHVPGAVGGEDGFATSGYEGVPEPAVVQGDLAIYEPSILIDKQHKERQFLSLVVENRGNRLQRLTSAKIEGIPSVKTVVAVWQENDVQLIQIDQIAVNARETVSIGPDSLALQLDLPKIPLKEGDKYKVTVTFEPAGNIDFSATVSDVGVVTAIEQNGLPGIDGGLAPGLGRAK